jgi:hypothetical protein
MSGYFSAFKTIGKVLKGNKSKVSPTIKSVKPTKDISGSVKRVTQNVASKRIADVSKVEDKMKSGKQMMKEAQKERKKLVDTGRAFQFKSSKTIHSVRPGENPKQKYKGLLKEDKSQKKFKKGKELATGGRVGRRFGSPKPQPKTNVEKIKETFSTKKNLSPKQMKIAKLAGNKNKIDAADFKKLRGRG